MRITIQQLLMAGTHFGHLTRRWNPKMRPYIFMAKQGIHVIDLKQTQTCLEKACDEITKIAASGKAILFVGTKKQAKDIIQTEAKRCNSPYVNERWLGGTLTNFSTIRRSVKTLETHERKASDGTYDLLSKKERLRMDKERAKLEKVLGGIRDMKRLPGAVFIVDIKKENIAVAEARKLNIPIYAITDTNTDPDLVEWPIPANDDSFKSIGLIGRILTDAILEGQKFAVEIQEARPQPKAEKAGESAKKPPRKRRGRSRGGAKKKTDQTNSTAKE